MYALLLLIQSTATPYPIPQDTPAAVANCIYDQVEKLGPSSESDAAIAHKAFAACKTPFELMLAAREALVTKDAGYPPPEWNRAAWRSSATSDFKQMAMQNAIQVRQRR